MKRWIFISHKFTQSSGWCMVDSSSYFQKFQRFKTGIFALLKSVSSKNSLNLRCHNVLIISSSATICSTICWWDEWKIYWSKSIVPFSSTKVTLRWQFSSDYFRFTKYLPILKKDYKICKNINSSLLVSFYVPAPINNFKDRLST